MSAWQESIGRSLATITSRERAARGCGESEIREIERRSGAKLPDAYAAFLRAVGSSAGDFLRGSQFDLEFLRGTVEEDFAELLEEDGVDPLPSHGFIFFDHQGYQFFWFTLGAGPDPEVFHYSTTTKSHRAVAPSFSRWLEQRIESEHGVA
jgi:hypothetical protein